MDITLLNISELSRRLKISDVYCWYLLAGERGSEKRLQQIAVELRMDMEELKAQIQRNRAKRNGHAGNRAPAHTRTHGRPRQRRTSACP